MVRRLALVACLLLAGCGAGGPAPTAAPFTGTSAPGPDPDLRVTLGNEGSETVAATLRVVGVERNETVHERTYDLAPGTEREVYSLAEADPEGVERFRVTVAAGGERESVTVETSTCYGGVYGVVRADGGLDLTYAVC